VSPELTTNEKGAIAETAIVHAAVKLGICVYKPIVEGGRYDLIFDLGDELMRVQCKWAALHGDVIAVRCYSSRRSPTGFVRACYTSREVDALAAYCPELDRCYLLRLDALRVTTTIQLRVAAARNGQRAHVNWAEQFEFAATLGRTAGAIAQLGERLHGMQKVAGSSPAGSINDTRLSAPPASESAVRAF
jgi:hypothetical protein